MPPINSWKDALEAYKAARGIPGALSPEDRQTMVHAQTLLLGRCCGQKSLMDPSQLAEVLRIGRKAAAALAAQ
jgi:hypothetical protein